MPVSPLRTARLRAAYRDALDELAADGVDTSRIRLTTIEPTALYIVDRDWVPCSARRVDWRWADVLADSHRRARRPILEVAIWFDDMLCGLMIGPTSRRAHRVYIEGTEGSPLAHPLKGRLLLVFATVAEAYARQIGASSVWVWQPDPILIPKYRVLGYTDHMRRVFFGRRSRFCIKTLDDANEVLP